MSLDSMRLTILQQALLCMLSKMPGSYDLKLEQVSGPVL